ncbi:MAG: hypothetical protein ABL974_21865, partial [Prosthecobacter sp.]
SVSKVAVNSGVTTTTKRDPFADWEAALKAGKLADTKLRGELLQRMAMVDAARAWRMLMTSGLPVQRADIEGIADAWYEKDPAAAAKFGIALSDPLQRPAFLRQVLSKWFLEKPSAFAAWYETQAVELDLAQFISSSNMIYRPGINTLADLESAVQVSPPYSSFPDLVGRQFHEVWKQPNQRQAASDWLRRLTDDKVRDTTWKHLIAEVSKADPQAATAMLAEIGDARLRREASSSIAANLAHRDPQAALAYAAALPDEKAAATAWQSALCSWTVSDPKQALEYIRQNLRTITPKMLDPAARELAASHPVEALEIAASFPKSNERSSLIGNLISGWRNEQPVEAKKWLDSTQATILPAAELERFRNKPVARYPGQTGYSTTVNGRRISYNY